MLSCPIKMQEDVMPASPLLGTMSEDLRVSQGEERPRNSDESFLTRDWWFCELIKTLISVRLR